MTKAFPSRILAARFSAFGDVALLVPVFRQFLEQYPEVEIRFLSRPQFEPLFRHLPRLQFEPIDLESKYQGVLGTLSLMKKAREWSQGMSAFADFHNSLRTQAIRIGLKGKKISVAVLDKGRNEKRKLIQKKEGLSLPLLHTSFRYVNVLSNLGFSIRLQNERRNYWCKDPAQMRKYGDEAFQKLGLSREEKEEVWIGLAPFAKHHWKVWPPGRMVQVTHRILTQNPSARFFLFGSSSERQAWNSLVEGEEINPSLQERFHWVAGELTLEQELALMSRLQVMVTMDSANQHLASIVGTQVMTIWGATHPDAGFSGFGQSSEDWIQVPQADLNCRPCSIYGNRICHRGDHACMNQISAEQVSEKILRALA